MGGKVKRIEEGSKKKGNVEWREKRWKGERRKDEVNSSVQ